MGDSIDKLIAEVDEVMYIAKNRDGENMGMKIKRGT